MAAKKMAVHCVEIEDKPGSLYKLLSQAAAEGVDFHCFLAAGTAEGKAVAYLSAKEPAVLEACAKKAGIETCSLTGFVFEGEDKVGAAANVIKGLTDAGINGVAAAAMVCDGKFQMGIIVKQDDADAAEKALKA